MQINHTTFEQIVNQAKAKAAGQAAWVRAIEKAAEQLADNPYICEHDGGLLILSYSNETYHANGACQCKAYASGRPCWHRAAAQLVKRYNEAVAAQAAASAAAVETAATDDRVQLIADIKAAWHRARPFESLEGAVRQVFGVAKLEDVATDDLRRVLAALTPANAHQRAAPRRPSIPYHHELDACAPGKGSLMRFYGLAVAGYRVNLCFYSEAGREREPYFCYLSAMNWRGTHKQSLANVVGLIIGNLKSGRRKRSPRPRSSII